MYCRLQTPKSFLSFLRNYKSLYAAKLAEVRVKEERVNMGLKKLTKGAEDVEAMKLVLADEQKKLQKATEETNKMLGSLEVSSLEAEKEATLVAAIKANCMSEAARIKGERDSCQADLAKAQPFVEEAIAAINSIKPAHITEVKAMKRPSDIIRLVFDGVLILFHSPLTKAVPAEVNVNKRHFEFINPSWSQAIVLMGDTAFLKWILEFPKDSINDETIELLMPYMDMPEFLPKVARAASVAAEGLCTWVRSMVFYTQASKIVKPKLEALQIAEGQFAVAMKALHDAEERQAAAEARLKELKGAFEAKVSQKRQIEDNARLLKRKMEQAANLIRALDGERERWSEDSATFADVKRRLLGDCAVACAFISYCGPFNQPFRQYLIADKFTRSARKRGVPVTHELDVINFLVRFCRDYRYIYRLHVRRFRSMLELSVIGACKACLRIPSRSRTASWLRAHHDTHCWWILRARHYTGSRPRPQPRKSCPSLAPHPWAPRICETSWSSACKKASP
jgi:dynein heavy chain